MGIFEFDPNLQNCSCFQIAVSIFATSAPREKLCSRVSWQTRNQRSLG